MTIRFAPEKAPGGTLMATLTPSAEAMEQLLAIGRKEGIQAAAGQMDDVLLGTPA